MLDKIKSRKRAVSPVIAAILLIGLTVMAGGVIAFIIIPMLNPPFSLDNVEVGVDSLPTYSDSTNKTTIKISVNNQNTASTTIESVHLINYNTSTPIYASLPTKPEVASGTGKSYTFEFMGNYKTAISITVTFKEGAIPPVELVPTLDMRKVVITDVNSDHSGSTKYLNVTIKNTNNAGLTLVTTSNISETIRLEECNVTAIGPHGDSEFAVVMLTFSEPVSIGTHIITFYFSDDISVYSIKDIEVKVSET